MKLAAAALLAFWAGGASAQMYKCVDARGVTHYADKPTAGCTNAKVDIRPSPPLSGRLAPPEEDRAQQEADFRRRQAEREDAEREVRSALATRCASLREEHGLLASGRRLIQVNPNGEQRVVDDAVRDRRLAEVEAALARCP